MLKFLLLIFILILSSCSNNTSTDEQDQYIESTLLPLLPQQKNKTTSKILIRKSITLKQEIMNSKDIKLIESKLLKLTNVRLCLLSSFLESNGSVTEKSSLFFTSESAASKFASLEHNSFYPNNKKSKEEFYMHITKYLPEYSELTMAAIIQPTISSEKCSNITLE